MSELLAVTFSDKEATLLFEALRLQIQGLQNQIDTGYHQQWVMLNSIRDERLLGEARLSLQKIRDEMVLDAKAEAARGFEASMHPLHAAPPFNAVPYTEKILENYAKLVLAFQGDIRRGYEELERQLSEGILPPTVESD